MVNSFVGVNTNKGICTGRCPLREAEVSASGVERQLIKRSGTFIQPDADSHICNQCKPALVATNKIIVDVFR